MLNIRIMPVTQWPGKETKNPKGSTFRSGYKDTLKLLEYELGKAMRLSSLIWSMWVDPGMITLDGSAVKRMQGSKTRELSFGSHERRTGDQTGTEGKWVYTPAAGLVSVRCL
jgi:hypothetical protein